MTTETHPGAPAEARVPPAAGAPDGETVRPYRMTVDVYDRLVESGVFGDKSPVFLWEGQLVLPMTKGPDHDYPLVALHAELFRLLPGGWHVRQECPVKLFNVSVPEPDLSVVRGALRDFRGRTPAAADVAVAAEVASTSLPFDAVQKKAAYARAAIPVYWIVNIPGHRIDVYSRPGGPAEAPGYAEHRAFGPGEEVPVVLDGAEVGRVAVSDVLP